MGFYSYKVLKNFNQISGTLQAENKQKAIEILIAAGYQILKINKQFLTLKKSSKLSQQDLICFFSSMSSMDKVGIDILYALEMMKDDIATTQELKYVCEKIYFLVSSGLSLSEACKKASSSFSDDFIGLIYIAEETGNFASIFDQIVDYIKWSYELNKRSKSAMIGPIVSIIMTIGIIIAMSTMVLPKIVTFLEDMSGEIPWYTKSLIVFASFVENNWYIIGGVFFALFAVVKLLSRANEKVGRIIDYFILKIPMIGELVLKLDVSRFISFFTLMYNSGADILVIVESISKTVNNKYLSWRIKEMKNFILNGETIFQAIDRETVFPKMFRKLLCICETTGEIGNVLANIKFFYDQEIKDFTEKVISLIKPALTVVLGGVVLWMALAMMMPIYANMGSLGQQNGL